LTIDCRGGMGAVCLRQGGKKGERLREGGRERERERERESQEEKRVYERPWAMMTREASERI